eukprot:scaffold155675_cov77-Cyclotella_meneghiniana.AAC.1
MTLAVSSIALGLPNRGKRNNTILAIGLLCILSILCNVFYWEEEYDEINFWGADDDYFVSRSLSIQNSEGPLHHPYETLIPPSKIDYSVDERLSYPENEDSCNDILLYMPYEHSINGQGAQLNAYIKVSLLATFLNKALVIIEADKFHTLTEWKKHMPASTLYDSGSQFGCPADAFNGEEMIENFPMGLSRLIQHPRWVGRGCPVPTCGGTMNYNSWEKERSESKSFWQRNKHQLHEIHCDEGGRQVKITTLGSGGLIRAFNRMTGIQQKMLDRSSPASRATARLWAMRLGASEEEAHSFSEIKDPNQIWDYLSALVNRSGLLRFQPWVARDVQEHIQTMNLPLDGPYDAFHIRRGDKLLREAKKWVNKYWNSQGRIGKQVTNYIPFSYYLKRAYGKCKANAQVKNRNLKDAQVKTVYVATDDPDTVHREINTIPRVNGKGASLVDECNHKVNFVFAPTPKDKAFHVNDRRAGDDCHKVYKRNIAAISDLIILIRSQKFVGDYNSNWGRFIKIARSFLNPDGVRPLVFMKSTIAVFGNMHPGVPGS